MKNNLLKGLSLLTLLAILLTSLSLGGLASVAGESKEEMKGVWISFLEFQTMLQGKSQEEFTTTITKAFDNSKALGLNTVIVQVRPYSDALYKSDYFPWSHIGSGTEGVSPGFDPLEIMVTEAHARGLKIEAWINPYRVRPQGNTKALAANSPAKKWLDAKDSAVIQHGTLISYNPASVKAQNLIVAGVKEIVTKYKVDGIHIDDYFYPYTGTDFDKTFDMPQYNAYVKAGGTLTHANWRRGNVEVLLKKMYAGVKEANPKVVFGISPQSSVANNFGQQYLDVKKIASTAGYCDYIAPQIYFGFDNGTQPFAATLDQWSQLTTHPSVDLYIGLAPYKIGTADGYAGAGKNEWVNNSNLLARMVTYGREKTNVDGFILYRYDHMFRPATGVSSQVAKETAALKNIM